jgi:hypothetical protein
MGWRAGKTREGVEWTTWEIEVLEDIKKKYTF